MLPAFVALLLASAPPTAPAEVAVVDWQVPPGCPAVDALHAGIRRALGGLDLAPRAVVQVGVRVTETGGRRFRLELRLDAGDGPTERTLTTDRCDAAIDTAAWLVAIAIDVRAADPATPAPPPDPEPRVPPPPPEPAPTPAPAPPPDREPTIPLPPPEPAPASDQPPPASTSEPAPPRESARSADPRNTPPPPRNRLQLDLWAGGGPGLGVLPRLTPTAALGFTLAGPRWAAELSGHFWAPRDLALGDRIGGRFVHGHAAARGCGAWARGRVRLPVCAGLALGGVTGRGTGALVSHTARSLWVGLLAGAGVRVRLHPRVGLLAHAEAVFGVRRPGFLLEPAHGLVFRPAPVGFSAHLALAIRLR